MNFSLHVSLVPGIQCVTCGSYRRGSNTCGDVDMLMAPPEVQDPPFLHYFTTLLIRPLTVTPTPFISFSFFLFTFFLPLFIYSFIHLFIYLFIYLFLIHRSLFLLLLLSFLPSSSLLLSVLITISMLSSPTPNRPCHVAFLLLNKQIYSAANFLNLDVLNGFHRARSMWISYPLW